MRLFGDFFGEPWAPGSMFKFDEFDLDEGSLAVDLSEDDKNIIVRASLPGFKRDDIDVEFHDGILNITATHTEEMEDTTEKFYRKERRLGSVSRRIALPTGAATKTGAKADLVDGVLTIRVPRTKEATPSKIKVS
jgi:HSP20 family protein